MAGSELLLFGDSITFAWPMPMRETGRRVHSGIPGETSLDMLRRFDADVLARSPRNLQIMAGTNDVAENGGPYDERTTVAAIAVMAERAAVTGATVLIASVPPAGTIFWSPAIDAAARIRSLNHALAVAARGAGARFVDYHPVLADADGAMRSALADDGVHPNGAGYAAMETVLGEALAEIRRRSST
jgi:lysophospholipase L1-like esterase